MTLSGLGQLSPTVASQLCSKLTTVLYAANSLDIKLLSFAAPVVFTQYEIYAISDV
jgi:hypothetical protein